MIDSLKAKSPPAPLFYADIQWTKVCLSMALDLVTYGTGLTLTYAFAAQVLKKISGKVNPPSLTSRVWNTTSMLLPFAAYRCVQIVVGLLVHPISFPFIGMFVGAQFDGRRGMILDQGFMPLRFSARSGFGHTIDGIFLKNPKITVSTDENPLQGRCIVFSVGNSAAYESFLMDRNVYALSKKLNANLLVYNYAGVVGSSGFFPNQDAMVASHSAMLDFLEALGAKEIVDFGWSIGGGVQWRSHSEKTRDKKRYCVVSYKTFLSTRHFGERIAGWLGGFGVSFLRWNYDNETAMKQSMVGKVVVQTVGPNNTILSDGVIDQENALGKKAKKDEFVGTQSPHNKLLSRTEIEMITEKVNHHFSPRH